MADEGKDDTESSWTACPVYDKLLEIMSRATDRLDLPWKRKSKMMSRDVCGSL